MPLDDPWSYWPRSPPDPARWTIIAFVQGDEEGPYDDAPQMAAVACMLEEEAQACETVGVWCLGSAVVSSQPSA
jgi:hypothetical protein